MRIDVLSIFPGMFDGVINESILKIAQREEALEFYAHDLRDWTHDLHRSVDDSPYGGGAGMVMKVEPLANAIEAITALDVRKPHIVFMAPVGKQFSQGVAAEYAGYDRLLLVCGRYEGFDERAFDWADDCLSIGDYVLAGGELPAMVVIEAVTRLLPSVLGNSMSIIEESFSADNDGLLEHPQYTRPADFRGKTVPKVLLSGNHAEIEKWRKKQSLMRTQERRPDLL
ncbi:MAG: tRNA (guanosine(37)-N1)-methyltransferase TrmD [Coriobacteriia bacterium]|nr:tRNA (guanosine(37)-N1)-methyltransferase TrmD [Coriobacteriia bacterium]MCL2746153.1 tRNA (guanosine(37)-N1)-methyltransferase TrmD [Coriobacteriia bacterium]MCL2870174.1 tRNA (guanosine(37)-N1)-methyltransferase TrmD [Coriobacteriia bacterium]